MRALIGIPLVPSAYDFCILSASFSCATCFQAQPSPRITCSPSICFSYGLLLLTLPVLARLLLPARLGFAQLLLLTLPVLARLFLPARPGFAQLLLLTLPVLAGASWFRSASSFDSSCPCAASSSGASWFRSASSSGKSCFSSCSSCFRTDSTTYAS